MAINPHIRISTDIKTTESVLTIKNEHDIQQLESLGYDQLIPWQSIYDILKATAACYGDRPALTLVGEDPLNDAIQQCSHSELLALVTQAANMYAQLGVERQTVVAILSRSHFLVPALILGAEVAGVANTINYLLAPSVIAALLKAVNAQVLVCSGPQLDPEIWAKTLAILELADCVKTLLVLGGTASHETLTCLSVEALLAQQDDKMLHHMSLPTRTDIAALFHTGGTTGTPKLVPQTHLNQIHAAWSLAQSFNLSHQDIALNGFPLFHVGGTSTIGMSVLACGGHVVMLSPAGLRNPKVVQHIWRLVERFHATYIGGVPTSIGSMSEVPVENCDISSVRFAFTGGATLPTAIAERFEQRTGIPLLEQYGMTESVAALTATPLHGQHVRGSVGLRSPFSSVRILRFDTHSNKELPCAVGEVGSVVVYGPQIVQGYLNPDHNIGAFTEDGGLITGDLGYLDEHHYLFLTGREKDLIIRSGHNIDPIAIEEVINAHPSVRLSAAVGMPDEYAGEVPVAFIETQDPNVDIAELETYLRTHIIEPPARPRHLFLIDAIPVTAVGKIFKPALRELALEKKLTMLLQHYSPELQVKQLQTLVGQEATQAHITATKELLCSYQADVEAAIQLLPLSIQLYWEEK